MVDMIYCCYVSARGGTLKCVILIPSFLTSCFTWLMGRGGKVDPVLPAGVGASTGGVVLGVGLLPTLLVTLGVGGVVSKTPFSSGHPQRIVAKSPFSAADKVPSWFESP